MILWAVATTGVMLLAVVRWPQHGWLQTSFYSLLPTGESQPWQQRSNEAAAAQYEQQLVILVSGPSSAQVSQFIQLVDARLLAGGYVEGRSEEREAAAWAALSHQLYPFRWGLLASADRERLEQDSQAYLTQFRRLLYSPLGGALASSLQSDPAGLFRSYLEAAVPEVEVGLDTDDAEADASELAIYQMRQQQGGFGADAGLYHIYVALRAEAEESGLQLRAAGATLYSAYGVYSAEREMSTIGAASLLLVIVLLVTVLRSISALVLTMLCVLSAILGGLLLTVALLQQIHILTLVFGATIIGIAADYAFHYLAHGTKVDNNRFATLDRVFVGLATGVVTSVVAFIALTVLPFPGIRQIGVFMASGLLCGFFTVCLLFPALHRFKPDGIALPRFCRRQRFSLRRGAPLLLVLALFAVFGLTALQPRDDVREFYGISSELEADQAAIELALSGPVDSRYLLVVAADTEALLKTEERLQVAAQAWINRGELQALSGVSSLLPSAERQQQNFDVLSLMIKQGYLDDHMQALGFNDVSRQEVLAGVPDLLQPLGLDSLGDLTLPTGAGGFLGCIAGECASWMRPSGVASVAVLQALADAEQSVQLVDPIANINTLLSDYRMAVLIVLACGGGLITLLLTLVYSWRLALRVMLLPLASCVLSLSITGLIEGSYSVVNLLAMLLIIGVSLDYAIFRSFSSDTGQPATTLAITLSALTSILAFGLLAFSDTPLIASFGQTIAFGLCFAYVLSWYSVDVTA